jgi:hypothetical protein
MINFKLCLREDLFFKQNPLAHSHIFNQTITLINYLNV